MSRETIQLDLGPLSAHAFNKDRSQVAISNSNEVLIYQRSSGSDWQRIHTLQGHDKLVTSIDWAPTTNRIVTCSQDRNAYVWTLDGASQQWKPTLVLLRLNRAATFVRWSPKENKFAVASGARMISVCHFEEDNDWWVSKHLRRPLRSTVLSLDWHPNNVLLAAGSADMKARVFSAYIKGVDEKPPASPWGDRLPFGILCAEYTHGPCGWVHDVAFSPEGDRLAWVGHGSSVSVATPASNQVVTVKTALLPRASLIWLTPQSLVAVGYDCTPVLFSQNDRGEWMMVEKLDQSQKKAALSGNTAFNKFRQMDSRAQTDAGTGTELNTIHQNTITSIRVFEGQRDAVKAFSTSGVDGRLTIWDVRQIEQGIAGLRIQ